MSDHFHHFSTPEIRRAGHRRDCDNVPTSIDCFGLRDQNRIYRKNAREAAADLAISFDKVASIYDATRWSGVPAPIMQKILVSMKEALRECHLILDVGSGTGRFAQYFQDDGFTVVGVDLSLSMMAQAREKGVRDLVRADAHRLPFRDQSFDGSIMIHVLHLVHDWVQTIREVGRVTRRIMISEAGDAEGFSVRQRYLEIRHELGYPLNRLNDGEFGLRKIISPKFVMQAGDYWTEVRAKEEISSLEARRSSVMLDLPKDIHGKIMKRLHADYDGKILKRHDIPEVVGWDPTRLREFKP